jgi:hypothetical protein
MKRVLLLSALLLGLISGFADARGFGGGGAIAAAGAPIGEGIGGTGALWTDGIMGAGGMWANGAYANGLPGYEGAFGAGAAYGGFFSGPPRLAMKSRETYNPLAGEQQAIGGSQLNVNAQRQNFARSLAGMGVGIGGFQPGEFGPPPRAGGGLPSDMGMHQAGGTGAYGYAHSGRGTPAANTDGTRDWAAADLRVFGNEARAAFRDYSVFTRDWFARYPRAWNTRGYARDIWSSATWADVDNWLGGELPNYQYTYGSDLVYDGNTVYLCGRPVAAADKYYESAVKIASSAEQPNARNAGEWLPLGVFEAIRSGQKSSPMLFQLAVSRTGAVRGNYFDTTDKNVQTIEGAVDKDTQRVAWIVADKGSVVFDCVLYNLTRAETPVLVHLGPNKNEQWVFVRLAREEAGR